MELKLIVEVSYRQSNKLLEIINTLINLQNKNDFILRLTDYTLEMPKAIDCQGLVKIYLVENNKEYGMCIQQINYIKNIKKDVIDLYNCGYKNAKRFLEVWR